MSNAVGKKIGMTRVYEADGAATPVTVIQVEPNVVTQVKTVEKDGYRAAQVAAGVKSPRRVSKPQQGHFKKANVQPKAFVCEYRLNDGEEVKEGQELLVNQFEVGQFVDVIGVSKGKGFQGVMRRHNFHGQGAAHGSMMHRRPGAIGHCATPGLVSKGKPMPGHLGDSRVTVQNLKVVQVREDDNLLLVRGAIPGARGSYVIVRDAIKKEKAKKAA